MERSLMLIKPDAVTRGLSGAILSRVEASGLKMTALKMLHVSPELAASHYAAHQEKPFFPGLIAYITSAPVVAAIFEGDGAVGRIRALMGPTNPTQAEPGTIRHDFGIDIERNAVHGSDSAETAEKEVKLFFDEQEFVHYNRAD
ncbi:MAG: nucleoside-diphosphate kinase [Dehalococcoidia bacterium]|nr:nucleoside-diphosphate kinase [Dehalococcoidia bacterium]